MAAAIATTCRLVLLRGLTLYTAKTPLVVNSSSVISRAVACTFNGQSQIWKSTSATEIRSKQMQDVGQPSHIERRIAEDMKKMDTLEHFMKSQPEDEKLHVPEKSLQGEPPMGAVALPHPIWSEDELHSVEITHRKPEGIIDKMAYASIKAMRVTLDKISGFGTGRNESKWITHICFLETVAGVPGMVAAMVRHLHSLRNMTRDHGWIHTLLEEAENERMHLMTALQLKQPGFFFRSGVVITQGVFVSFFSIAYLLCPRFCHRFVGYLEEGAVTTYTKLIKDMEPGGVMEHWNRCAAPDVAIVYWKLAKTATMRDVILAIRADEAHHRIVNHTLASMKPDEYNPYKPGQ